MSLIKFQYGLSYLSAEQSGLTPEIIFKFNSKYLDELAQRLEGYNRNNQTNFAFTLNEFDVFDELCFGYGNCGYLEKNGELAEIHIRINQNVDYITSTIFVLSFVLSVPFDTELESNLFEDIILYTVINREMSDHSLGGLLSINIIRWLQRYFESTVGKINDDIYMHKDVLLAMEEVLLATSKDGRLYKDYIIGIIKSTGHFFVECYGNACDLAVYPDQIIHEDTKFVQLSCHNVDNALQQIVLLTGLAKLCDLSRQ